jgi:hypothetical protein
MSSIRYDFKIKIRLSNDFNAFDKDFLEMLSFIITKVKKGTRNSTNFLFTAMLNAQKKNSYHFAVLFYKTLF